MSQSVTIQGHAVTIYGTVAARDAYLATSSRFYVAWSALTPEDKHRKSVDAMRNLNLRSWKGTKTSSSQPLAWPRTNASDPEGTLIDPAETPEVIEMASYVLAGLLAVNPNALGNGTAAPALQSMTEGPVSASFFYKPAGASADMSGTPTVDEIDSMIAGYLGDSSNTAFGSMLAGLASGTDGQSSFNNDQRYLVQDGIS